MRGANFDLISIETVLESVSVKSNMHLFGLDRSVLVHQLCTLVSSSLAPTFNLSCSLDCCLNLGQSVTTAAHQHQFEHQSNHGVTNSLK